jgi:tetratricopeptide (TPR) repeat protein
MPRTSGLRPIPAFLLLSACWLALSWHDALHAQAPAAAKPPAPCDLKVSGAAKCATQLYHSVALAFLRDHDAAKATAGFRQVLQLNPKYSPAWFDLGVLAEQRDAWEEAQSDFKQFLVVAPPGPDVARAAHELEVLKPYLAGTAGPAEEKQAEYDASIARARILLSKQLFKEAIAEAGHAQSLDDSRWEAYAVVSLAMYRQHKNDEGKKFADMALTRTPAEKRSAVAEALVPLP